MEEVVYVILARTKDRYNIIYVDETEKTDKSDFFTSNEKYKCWLANAGSEDNLYLSIYPMWKSEKKERERIANHAISKYKPICNSS